jgi:hypothetical protein
MITDILVKFLLDGGAEVRQVHILTHLGFMFLSNKWRIEQRVYWSIRIRLWVLQFPKDGVTVHTMKQGVVIVGLVGEPSVIQEHILQMLAAFRLMCHSNGGPSFQNEYNCAKASGSYGWLPAMQRVVVVVKCGGEGVVR